MPRAPAAEMRDATLMRYADDAYAPLSLAFHAAARCATFARHCLYAAAMPQRRLMPLD